MPAAPLRGDAGFARRPMSSTVQGALDAVGAEDHHTPCDRTFAELPHLDAGQAFQDRSTAGDLIE